MTERVAHSIDDALGPEVVGMLDRDAAQDGQRDGAQDGQSEPIRDALLGMTPRTSYVWIAGALAQPADLVDGLIAPGVNIWSGEPGSMKSTCAYGAAAAIAAGLPSFLGMTIALDARGGRVLIIDKDNQPGLVMSRVLVAAAHVGLDFDCAADRIMHGEPTIFAKPLAGYSLATEIPRYLYREFGGQPHGVVLVIADTLGATGGVEEENDASEMNAVMTAYAQISDALGCPVVLQTHPAKMYVGILRQELEKGRTPPQEAVVRGSTSTAARATLVAGFAKQDDHIRVGIAKRRVGPAVSVRALYWEPKTVPLDNGESQGAVQAIVFTRMEEVAAVESEGKLDLFVEFLKKHRETAYTAQNWEAARKAAPRGEQPPTTQTVRKYFKEESATLQALGVRAEKRAKKAGGRKEWVWWWEDGEGYIEADDGGEE